MNSTETLETYKRKLLQSNASEMLKTLAEAYRDDNVFSSGFGALIYFALGVTEQREAEEDRRKNEKDRAYAAEL